MHCESLDSPMTVSISAARARPSSGSAENALYDLSGPWVTISPLLLRHSKHRCYSVPNIAATVFHGWLIHPNEKN